MKKPIFLSVVLFLGIIFSANAQNELANPIPADPSVRTGVLSNGLTYFIKKNGKPEKRCELRLALKAGSMLETDEQQGLAHFVEHMCFNGTKNFKKSALVDFLESAGVKFGAHLNAYTSFDETVYMLQLPTDKEEIFTKGFQVLKDWSSDVSFEDEEIEKERGVVISERRGRLGADERMRLQYWPIIFEGSRYADRLPIGTLPVLQGFKPETLKAFYQKWYRPDLMAVIAIGDFDLDKVETLIKGKFSEIPARTDKPQNELFPVPDHQGLRVAIASDGEATQTSLEVSYKSPTSTLKTLGDMRNGLVSNMFNQMLGERFSELIKKGGTPFSYAYSNYGSYVRTKNAFTSAGMVKETSILEGFKILLTENERVKRHGFNKGELERAKKNAMTRMESAFKDRDKTESGRLIQSYVSSFLSGDAPTHIDFTYDFYKKYLDGVTLEEVNALAKKWITDKGDNATCVIEAPKKTELSLPTEGDIRRLFDEVADAKIEPLKEEATVTTLMKAPPIAGKITAETKNDALGLTEWTLSNGAKVIFKPTTFKNEEILVSSYSPGGYTMYPISDKMNGMFASFGVSQSGIGDLDAVAFQRFMTGKIARISPYIGELFEGLNGSYAPKDAETAFQIMNLYFTAPRKDDKMFDNVVKQQKVFMENMSKSPDKAFSDTVTVAMYGNNPRRQPMNAPDLDLIKADRSFEIYKDRFADADDFTFFFVGNIDEKTFRPLVETYIASLPTKGRKENWVDPNITPVAKPLSKNVAKGIEPKSTVQLTYLGDMKYTRRNNFEMNAFVKLLETKLREKIREEKGGTYGVRVQPSLSKYPKERYQLTISFGCAPEKADELMAAALGEVADVLKSGTDDKNLVKVKETFLRERETDLKENRFWLSYISTSYQNGMDVMDMQKYNDWVNALTTSDFKKMAKKFIKKANLMKFTLKPETKA
jgi:zinc protease